jgi:hypothetical protein
MRFTNKPLLLPAAALAKVPFTFATASLIAERLSASGPARCKVVSNEFKSALATHKGWEVKVNHQRLGEIWWFNDV